MSRASRALVVSTLFAIALVATPALARAAEASGTAETAPVEAGLEKPASHLDSEENAIPPADVALDGSFDPIGSVDATDAVSPVGGQVGEKALPTDADAAVDDAAGSDKSVVTPGGSCEAAEVAAAPFASVDQADDAAGSTPAVENATDAAKSAAEKAGAPDVSPSADETYYEEDEVVDLYRLYNPYSGEHFYTDSAFERDVLSSIGWNDEGHDEGLAWKVPTKRGDSVYRLYNPYSSDHHYTLSQQERDELVRLGWNYEGVAWRSATFGRLPVWRLYNPYVSIGSHHYTLSSHEYECLVRIGWNGESVGFYAVDPNYVLKDPTKDFSHGVVSLAAGIAAADGSNPQTLRSAVKHDALYLFLPAYADLTKVTLSAFDAAGRPFKKARKRSSTSARFSA